jgi:N-acylneuraminate cytidylyltransferase
VAHIDRRYRLIERLNDLVAPLHPFQNPFKMWRIDPDGYMQPLIQFHGVDEPYNMPRQALPEVYWQTGYVDAAWSDTILTKNSMTGDRILPLVIDPSEWIDIDSPDDWRRAERLLESGEVSAEELGFEIG